MAVAALITRLEKNDPSEVSLPRSSGFDPQGAEPRRSTSEKARRKHNKESHCVLGVAVIGYVDSEKPRDEAPRQ
jgi:hypothetical protein